MKQNLHPKAGLADTIAGRDFDMGQQIATGLPEFKASSATKAIALTPLAGGGDRFLTPEAKQRLGIRSSEKYIQEQRPLLAFESIRGERTDGWCGETAAHPVVLRQGS